VSLPAQNYVTLTTNNANPVEGCDVVTFTIEVCNVHGSARETKVRMLDLEYFEVVD
jgi:hypothetical protein